MGGAAPGRVKPHGSRAARTGIMLACHGQAMTADMQLLAATCNGCPCTIPGARSAVCVLLQQMPSTLLALVGCWHLRKEANTALGNYAEGLTGL